MSCYDALGIRYSIYQPATALHSQQQAQQEQQLNMTVASHYQRGSSRTSHP